MLKNIWEQIIAFNTILMHSDHKEIGWLVDQIIYEASMPKPKPLTEMQMHGI